MIENSIYKTISCSNCIYYSGSECRRYPPRLLPGEEDTDGYFPCVDADNWCGEHKIKQ